MYHVLKYLAIISNNFSNYISIEIRLNYKLSHLIFKFLSKLL